MLSGLIVLLIQTGLSTSGGKVSGKQTLSVTFYIQVVGPTLQKKMPK